MLKNWKSFRAIVPILGVLFLTIAIPTIWIVPQRQVEPLQNVTDPNFANHKERIAAENAARTVLVQGFGGLFVAATVVVGWLNYLAVQEKQAAERFSKAVEQLGSDNIHVRLGGIYALEQISKDAEEKYYWQVMETLTAYVRERSPYNPCSTKKQTSFVKAAIQETTTRSEEIPPLPTDIQVAVTVLCRRKYSYRNGEDYRLDLRNTDLRRLQLQSMPGTQANLQGVNLAGANLQNAVLHGVNMQQANLERANLQGAELKCVDLGGLAELNQADLRNTRISKTNLEKARLWEADLREAHLEFVNLKKANLGQNIKLQGVLFLNVDMEKASLSGANLAGLRLSGINLKGAKLFKASLKNTSLDGADLREVDLKEVIGLTWEQLKEAGYYDEGLIPTYLTQKKSGISA